MAKCDLTIIFDDNKRDYLIGDKVCGVLKVEVDKPCSCKAVSIEKRWQTSGVGNNQSGGNETIVLFEGELSAGVNHFLFEFTLDEAPVTCHGKIVNLDWILKATADIPWAIDPKIEQTITVDPNPQQLVRFSPELQTNFENSRYNNASHVKELKWRTMAPMLVILFSLASIPAILILTGVMHDDVLNRFGAGVFLLMATFAALHMVKPLIAQYKLGQVSFDVVDKNYGAADEVEVRISFIPPKNLSIKQIKAQLVFREISVSGGDKKTTHKHQYAIAEQTLVEDQKIRANALFLQSVKLPLPKHVMHSFCGKHSQLKWLVVVDIDIDYWPDWHREKLITVVC